MRLSRRGILTALLLAAALTIVPAPRALASHSQEAMFEDDVSLMTDPADTLVQMRLLGVTQVRLAVFWYYIAPSPHSKTPPPNFNGANPAAYPAAKWAIWDEIVRDAQQDGITLNLDPRGGAPQWAQGPGRPAGNTSPYWEPNAAMYGAFVHALGVRYSGNYDPVLNKTVPHDPLDLPRVSSWSVWNEPDYGPSLSPQGLPGHLTIEHSPEMYRELVDAAWNSLHQTGHGSDRILWGELAPRGMPYWGVFSGMAPLVFLRAMFCVDASYHPLLGAAAALRGCPTTTTASHSFRAQNPALFQATGVSDHPYMRWYAPNDEQDPNPDFTSLAQIGNLARALDRLERVYGSSKRFPIYDTEFGYLTNPPKRDIPSEPANERYPWISQATAAYYLNWAEYISWRNPRIASFFQYLLHDPEPATLATGYGGFASGLLNYNGTPKPTYAAWRLPLYLPVTNIRQGHSVEVWGCVRPAYFASLDTAGPQTVAIQLGPSAGGPLTTVRTVTITNPAASCYFDVRVKFPASGAVRLAWIYPTLDPLLGYLDPLQPHTAYSRHVQINVS